MSLVGTRPPTVDEWEQYELHHRSRMSTKPGITGMWQVSGRSDITDFEEVVRLDGKKAYEYSRKLRNYYGDSSYHDIIVSESKKLYNENSFPISEVDEEQYFTCRNIMDILYRSDGEKFLQYCDDLKEKCDNMSKHRIETLLGQIVKN